MATIKENWEIARYRFDFRVTQSIKTPEYAGSQLRGAFGRALRKISCMTKQRDCKSCPLYRSCPYPAIFETPAPENHSVQNFSQVPNGYVIEAMDWGARIYQVNEIIQFNMVLFGHVLRQLPLIAYALQRAFSYQVGGGQAELMDICYTDNQQSFSIFQQQNIISHTPQLILPEYLPTKIQLKFVTPLRIQNYGRILNSQEISLERMIISLAKRLLLLSEFHLHYQWQLNFEQLKSEIAQIKEEKYLQRLNWTRYSSRQKQSMQLDGVVGEWHLTNVSEQIQKLLYLGQWLHCGKNATFGLGGYKITNL